MVILTSFPPPEEGIEYRQAATEAHVGPKFVGAGTLYIAQSRLSWVGDNGQGFSLEYPGISLHAVSRDLSTFPKECLYLMVDGKLNDENEEEAATPAGEESEDEDQEEGSPYTEVRFAPSDTSVLDSLYSAMCDCQALHPDSEASFSDDEEEQGEVGAGDYFDNAEGANQLTAQGRATLRHLESIFVTHDGEPRPHNGSVDHIEPMEEDEPGQFEDAD